MLRTNSKKAKANIRKYIVDNFDGANYSPDFDYIETAKEENRDGIKPEKDIFSMVKEAINYTFYVEYLKHNTAYNAGRYCKREAFAAWAAGLPSILDTCYFYNRSAVADLGGILEETEEERSRYTEQQAEILLTNLIFRELDA